MKRAAVYARVSTTEQTCENQLQVLRAFAGARGWLITEFVDAGQKHHPTRYGLRFPSRPVLALL